MKAHEFLTKDKWIKGTYARDSFGRPVGSISALACSFCAVGALYQVYGCYDNAEMALMTLAKVIDPEYDVSADNAEDIVIRANDSAKSFEQIHKWMVKADV